MFTIIGADQKQYGPATADEIRSWIRDGRADGRTLARSDEAGGDWKPLASFPEFAAYTSAQGVPPRLPGAPVPPVPGNFVPIANTQLLAGELDFDLGQCLGHAWELWMNNFGLLTVSCAVIWFLEQVPILGALMNGVLYGGLYLVYLKRIRGQPASSGESLAGFSNNFLQLFLVGFVSGLLASLGFLLCGAGWIFLKIAWIFSIPLVMDKRLEFWTAMELSRKVTLRVWFKTFGLMFIAFAPTILVKGYELLKTEVLMYNAMNGFMAPGQFDFAKMLNAAKDVATAMTTVNALAAIVLLINLPFATGALMYAYEALFSPRPTKAP